MKEIVEAAFGLVSRVNTVLIVMAGWCILLITAFTFFSVIMRYSFGRPDTWSYPLSAYLLCIVVFFAAAHTLQDNMHVRVDYVLQLIPRRLAVVLAALGDIASSVFLAIFTWQTWRLFNMSLARGRIDETTLGWPLAAIQWVLPAAGALLLLTHLLIVVRRLYRGEYLTRPPATHE